MEKLKRSLERSGVGGNAHDHLRRIETEPVLPGGDPCGYKAATEGQGCKKNCHRPVHLRYGKSIGRKRQSNRMTRSQPLPLLVLTGFLGSGKTTTLGHWLAHTDVPLKRVAVIINDFGLVNVDAALLARRQLELRSITGGCVCCQSFDDLVEQVRTISENPEIDLAWIETSGLADPEEVLDHLSTPELHDCAVIRRLILVIDSSDFPCSWRGRAVQEEQVRYADLILLNKIDRVDEDTRQRVEITLRQINPSAKTVMTRNGEVDPGLLSGSAGSRAENPARKVHDHEHDCTHEHCDHDHDDHDHDHDHHHELNHAASTLFLPLAEPVDRMAFQRFLGSLPTSVFRAKGFIRLSDSPGQLHTFQQVRDQAELLLLPLENGTDMTTGLVFIGPHLDEKHIRELAKVLLPTHAA
jgi:G3E family GTPase